MNELGIIEIKLENVSEYDTIRLQKSIHTLIANGSLNIRGGRAIIHFDSEANLVKIEHDFIKWLRPKEFNTPNLTKAVIKK